MKTSSGDGENEPDDLVSRAKRIARQLMSAHRGVLLNDIPSPTKLKQPAQNSPAEVTVKTELAEVPIPTIDDDAPTLTDSSGSSSALAPSATMAASSPEKDDDTAEVRTAKLILRNAGSRKSSKGKREDLMAELSANIGALVHSIEASASSFAAMSAAVASMAGGTKLPK